MFSGGCWTYQIKGGGADAWDIIVVWKVEGVCEGSDATPPALKKPSLAQNVACSVASVSCHVGCC